MGRDHVARHHGADARWRAGIDQVAGTQRHLFRQLRDHFRNTPDHLTGVTALAFNAVDRQPDRAVFEMSGIGYFGDRAARCRSVKTLADFPGQAHVAGVALALASREIDTDRVTPDVTVRIADRDVASLPADRR